MSNDATSLFDRLGGTGVVAKIVHEMFRRVLDDEELAPFFEHVPMERLRLMQYQFVTAALDGPAEYTGAELTAVHAGRGIRPQHFAKFCGHFADAMEHYEAAPQDVDAALGRLAMFKDKITGDANVDG